MRSRVLVILQILTVHLLAREHAVQPSLLHNVSTLQLSHDQHITYPSAYVPSPSQRITPCLSGSPTYTRSVELSCTPPHLPNLKPQRSISSVCNTQSCIIQQPRDCKTMFAVKPGVTIERYSWAARANVDSHVVRMVGDSVQLYVVN